MTLSNALCHYDNRHNLLFFFLPGFKYAKEALLGFTGIVSVL